VVVRGACLSHQCGRKQLRWLPTSCQVRSYASCRACWIVSQPHRAFGDAYGDPNFFAPFFEHATHLSATVCQLSPLNTSFIMHPSACVRLNTSDMIFRDSLLHFYSASILKNHRTALSHPFLSIDACHCFDQVSVKMQKMALLHI
jgi:hypothetical protein